MTGTGPEATSTGRLEIRVLRGVAAGVPERELAGLPGVEGDPNAGVYQVLERLDAHRLRVRPAAKADGTAAYSIGRRSYYEQRIGNAHFFFLDTRSHRGVSRAPIGTESTAQPSPARCGRWPGSPRSRTGASTVRDCDRKVDCAGRSPLQTPAL